jgi:Alcohol dehydrogenase GroES-like domain
MRATLIYGAGDVRVETVPEPALHVPTDAVVRVLRSCICGSDLWPYGSMPPSEQGRRIGHEFLGIVEKVGADVSGLKSGDMVLAPFVWADNTCDFCTEGLQTSCRHGGLWAVGDVDGGQGEAVRVPQAQGTLVKLPVGENSALLPSLPARRYRYGSGCARSSATPFAGTRTWAPGGACQAGLRRRRRRSRVPLARRAGRWRCRGRRSRPARAARPPGRPAPAAGPRRRLVAGVRVPGSAGPQSK